MPTYAMFLKDIVTKKRNVERFETIFTAKKYCSVINKLLPKQNDPGIFSIPCSIHDKYIGRVLYDLGSSINLMPKSILLNLGKGNARPTTMILQLADRSHVRPEGRIEDVIVNVDNFVFPADFLILDYEVEDNAPIILGDLF
ncbi:uncharacterized protein LOC120187023 [Hibiscus syriacus]|uniref:uncharacterized protein LOC120187023 n=1 Tax=Hibiscus syriacus TaxID=106335 RepID=UPI001924D7C2|nr:uncharacterized protein LOC120187023 [Hibiscus syriacus]